ncbi:MAG: cytoplasmic protein [Xanthomonadales bacterium]|nr:cytoplasmic protein [Xanthomonadales bacterium]NIX12040.1 cytoplasmic protein [Xanthomonadales bacterium]
MLKQFIVAAAFVAVSLPAIAPASEDAVVADPERYTVEFENDRVRVIRIKYGPGEKSVMHTHGPNVSVMLSDGSIRMHLPDGSTMDVPAKHGEATWADAEEHLPENTGGEPFEVVLVELKD